MAGLILGWIALHAAGSPPASQPSEPGTGPAAGTAPTLPRWLLPGMVLNGEPVSAADLPERFAAQTRALLAQADQATDPRLELDWRLAAANWMLARELEPAATRRMWGVSEPDDADQAGGITSAAATQLERAGALLSDLVDREALQGRERHRRNEALKILKAFASELGLALGKKPGAPAGEGAATQPAAGDSGLAALMEHDQESVAAAATFWLAFGQAQRGQLPRALDLAHLSETAAVPHTVWTFSCALLRYRWLADLGQGYAAPLALLSRLESTTDQWFAEGRRAGQARRTVALLRRQVLSRWQAELRAGRQSEQADWCAQAIARIDTRQFTGDQAGELLRLEEAIPLIVPLEPVAPADPAEPEEEPDEPEPGEQPAGPAPG